MIFRVVKNKYLNALLLLMLFSAIVHMVVLFVNALAKQDFYTLNYFNILDLDLIYPGLANSFWGNVFSLLCVAVLYFLILKINDKENAGKNN